MMSRLAAWSAGRPLYLKTLGYPWTLGILAAPGELAAGGRTRAVAAFLRAGGTGKGVLIREGRRGKRS